MSIFVLAFIVCISFSLSVFQAKAQSLNEFLAVDRFHLYISKLAGHIEKTNSTLGQDLKKISPEQIYNNKNIMGEITNWKNYDRAVYELYKEIYPNKKVTSSELAWNYNFLKRKLAESYVIKTKKTSSLLMYQPDSELRIHRELGDKYSLEIPKVEKSPLTLNAELYIADRTTRAIFWDSAKNNIPIDFYLGNHETFLELIKNQGYVIKGEVSPLARNYNPIYILEKPGEKIYRYAITSINGQERLRHLMTQMDIIAWNNKRASAQHHNATIYGTLESKYNRDYSRLRHQLEILPPADHVFVGQKGAISRLFRVALKAQEVFSVYQVDPHTVDSLLDSKQRKILKSALENKTFDNIFTTYKEASQWEKMHKKLEKAMPNYDIVSSAANSGVSITNSSHEFSDLTFKDKSGKTIRYRSFGNVWGDAIIPIVDAIIDSGHRKITYIGTVGALPTKNHFKVGDLVIPTYILDEKGKKVAHTSQALLPDGVRQKESYVTHVGSIYEETMRWMKDTISRGQNLVEVETTFLVNRFKTITEGNIMLLVSDVITKHTLDSASSTARKKSQINAIFSAFERDSVAKAVAPQESKGINYVGSRPEHSEIEKALSKKSTLYKYMIRQKYLKQGNLQVVMKSEPVFSDKYFFEKLSTVAEGLIKLNRELVENKTTFGLELSNLENLTYNPKKDKVIVQVAVLTSEDAREAKAIQSHLEQSYKDIFRNIEINVIEKKQSIVESMQRAFFSKTAFFELITSYTFEHIGLYGRFSKSGNINFGEVSFNNIHPATFFIRKSCRSLFRNR